MSLSIDVNKVSGVFTDRKLPFGHEVRNFISHLVSSILIPLLVPTYLCCILLYFFPQLINIHATSDKWLLFSGVFTATVLLPFILVFALYKTGVISSLTLYKRSDRFIPQTFSCLLYVLLSAGLIYKLGAENAMSLAMTANTISVLAITVITRFWKISTHAAGAIGFMSIVGMLYVKHPSPGFLALFLVVAVLSVTTCVARLYLKAHTLSQIIAGSILGCAIGVSVFYFLP